MAKRMIVMLAVTLLFVAALGFVKFKQIQTAIAQGAAFQPPPEAVTTIVASAGAVAVHAERHRHGRGRARRDRERRPAGHRRPDRLRVRPVGSRRRGAGVLDTRQERAQLAAAEAQRDLARAQLRSDAGPAERARDLAGGVRPRDRGTAAGGGAGRRNPRRDRAQDHPGAVLGRPRHPSGQPRSVPVGRRRAGHAAVAESDLRELRRAAAGAGQVRVGRERARHGRRSRRASRSPAASPRSTRSSTRRRATCRCRRRSPTPTARCVPGMFVQTEVDARRAGSRSCRCRHPRSATRRTATRCSSSPT